MEKGKASKEKQWSSAETELSSNEDTEGDEENVCSSFFNQYENYSHELFL